MILALIVLNVIVFMMYGSDKRKAKKDAWRTPERTLILSGLLAPWGALSGMYVFRHKTQKNNFKVIWLFAVVHIFLYAYLLGVL